MFKRLPVLDIEGPPLTNVCEWQVKTAGPVELPATYRMADIKAREPAEKRMQYGL